MGATKKKKKSKKKPSSTKTTTTTATKTTTTTTTTATTSSTKQTIFEQRRLKVGLLFLVFYFLFFISSLFFDSSRAFHKMSNLCSIVYFSLVCVKVGQPVIAQNMSMCVLLLVLNLLCFAILFFSVVERIVKSCSACNQMITLQYVLFVVDGWCVVDVFLFFSFWYNGLCFQPKF